MIRRRPALKSPLLKSRTLLREGQVILRAGQVLTSVTVDENMNKEQTEKVLDSVLNDINTMLKQQMNVTDQNAELIRVSRQDFDTAVNQIAGSKTLISISMTVSLSSTREKRFIRAIWISTRTSGTMSCRSSAS